MKHHLCSAVPEEGARGWELGWEECAGAGGRRGGWEVPQSVGW